MFVNAVKRAPRFVMSVIATVVLALLVFAVAGASVLGVSLAVQGWAAHPPTTVHAPVQR
ncbi:MAG: hypothetical protein ABI903_12150 [Actinomycetota bacterium]